MSRFLDPEVHAERRNEILDAAERLFYTKGYAAMTVQDLLDEAGMSNGAFFHYFESKAAVLEGFIERMQRDSQARLRALIDDPDLAALGKLIGFFDVLDHLRGARAARVIRLLQVWYSDANAVARQRVDAAVLEQRAPLLSAVARQGVREGVFKTAYTEQAGEVVMSLVQGMGSSHAASLLSLLDGADESSCADEIVATHAAYMEAIERVLGAARRSLPRTTVAAVKVWIKAVRERRGRPGRKLANEAGDASSLHSVLPTRANKNGRA